MTEYSGRHGAPIGEYLQEYPEKAVPGITEYDVAKKQPGRPGRKDKMKRSIAKMTVRQIAIFAAAALAVTSAVVFLLVRNIVVNEEKQFLERTGDIVKLSVTDFLEDSGMGIYDVGFEDLYAEQASEFCNRYDLDYIYIYEPDFDDQALTYILAAGSDETASEIPDVTVHEAHETDYTEDSLRLWNGELDYECFMLNSAYGYELGAVTVITDSSGAKAFLGLDRSVTTVFREVFRIFLFCALGELVVFALIFLFMYKLLTKEILSPVQKISTAMNDFAAADCRTEMVLDAGDYDEFRGITESFNRMAHDLHRYIGDITALTEEREKRRLAMQITEKIQMGLLPAPAHDTPQYKIRAMMKPAREVGGDLYDYCEIDDDNMLFTIADVSGKGITASMFMAIALSLIRQLAKLGKKPEEILTLVNRSISANNPEMFFVTAFVALYNKPSDLLTFSNAGHNLPYILRDGKLLPMVGGKSIPLGLLEEKKYTSAEIQLKGDDLMFLYTDGVTEAMNEQEELFTDQRLEQALLGYHREKDSNPVETVYQAVRRFCGDAEQSDDITMLTLELNHRTEITLQAKESRFSEIADVITGSAMPEKYKMKLCLVCEEWFINICRHGYAADAADKEVRFTLEISDRIKIVFEDGGVKYDPLADAVPEPALSGEQPVGGLGKLLIVRLADQVHYRYFSGKNILTITKFFDPEDKNAV